MNQVAAVYGVNIIAEVHGLHVFDIAMQGEFFGLFLILGQY